MDAVRSSRRFRDIPKDTLIIRMPRGLARSLRINAVEHGRSISEAVAFAVAQSIGVDPSMYGVSVDQSTDKHGRICDDDK